MLRNKASTPADVITAWRAANPQKIGATPEVIAQVQDGKGEGLIAANPDSFPASVFHPWISTEAIELNQCWVVNLAGNIQPSVLRWLPSGRRAEVDLSFNDEVLTFAEFPAEKHGRRDARAALVGFEGGR